MPIYFWYDLPWEHAYLFPIVKYGNGSFVMVIVVFVKTEDHVLLLGDLVFGSDVIRC